MTVHSELNQPDAPACACGKPARRVRIVAPILPDGTAHASGGDRYCDDCWPGFPETVMRIEGHRHVDA